MGKMRGLGKAAPRRVRIWCKPREMGWLTAASASNGVWPVIATWSRNGA
jgi:hypothetical protein